MSATTSTVAWPRWAGSGGGMRAASRTARHGTRRDRHDAAQGLRRISRTRGGGARRGRSRRTTATMATTHSSMAPPSRRRGSAAMASTISADRAVQRGPPAVAERRRCPCGARGRSARRAGPGRRGCAVESSAADERGRVAAAGQEVDRRGDRDDDRDVAQGRRGHAHSVRQRAAPGPRLRRGSWRGSSAGLRRDGRRRVGHDGALDRLGREAVADAEVRVDVAPVRRRLLELLAQLAHEDVDRAVAAGHRVAPDALVDLLALEHAALGRGEQLR